MRPPKEAFAGLFYNDSPAIRKTLKASPSHWGPMPPIPKTNWVTPATFPNLASAKVIGIDTETWDPELTEAGPGWGRGKGHIIGVSIAVEDGSSWYFPMRHGIVDGKQILPPDEAAMNIEPATVLGFLRAPLGSLLPKVGANLIYDVGWLVWSGVDVRGPLYDIQFAEALLNSETPSVALDNLAEKYLGLHKETEMLYAWLSEWNGKPANSQQRKWLYASPPSLAGPYAMADASLPIKILERQWPALRERGVLELFDLECRLIPLLVKMRLKGVPVNLNTASRVHDELGTRLVAIEERLRAFTGHQVEPTKPSSLSRAFQTLGMELPTKIDRGEDEEKVSFDKTRLNAINHPFAAAVVEWRELTKVRDTFIGSYVMDKHVDGRLFTTFHPLKGLDGGTRSGRFSSADPNLQNIPVRTEEGKLVRTVFDGTTSGNRWRSFDYSSIEYRLLAHFATGPGSDELRAIFANDPTADYHAIVSELIFKLTGIKLERGPTKTINFGLIYGMQLPSLALKLGLSRAEAKDLLDKYHAAAPYTKATMQMCEDEVHETGIVRTILNRASDFNAWGPKGYQEDGRPMPVNLKEAIAKWGYNIERQHTHKALNRKLQGSAADVMKIAMVEAYEAGLFEEHACGIPVLTVHDELDWEDKGDLDNPAWIELQRVMENCAGHLLKVPLLVDPGVGNTWADAH